MGHRQYSGNHPRFSKREDERYDAKEAYNKDLTASARLHYLENVRHDHDSPANMHTDAHMRRQAKKIARKTKGDAQDIYYEMKSKKMSEKKDSPAKNTVGMVGKTVRNIEDAKKKLRDEYNELSKREALKHPNMYYPPSVKIQNRMDAISDHVINPFNDPLDDKGRDMRSPVKMEGKGCAKSEGGSGCVVKRGGEYVILNNKKGGVWRSGFASRSAADKVLAAYHANK
tara:strand:+ start:399 stop:1082 length:684 start_codon:yes stop_codon:yes gene_type:complete